MIKKLLLIILTTPIILVLVIAILNNKSSTKVKFLIWQTPSLSIGQYLAISSISGFIISSTAISQIKYYKPYQFKKIVNPSFENKRDKIEDKYDYQEDRFNQEIDKDPTLIERELSSPRPTVSVPFRIISKESIEERTFNYYKSKDNYSEQDFEKTNKIEIEEEEYQGTRERVSIRTDEGWGSLKLEEW